MSKWRAWGRRAMIGLALLLVVLTFLPLWQTDKWWVREWDYPRLQLAGLLIVVAAALVWSRIERRWWLFGAVMGALAWQVSHFLAYLPLYPKEVAGTPSCRAQPVAAQRQRPTHQR